MRAGIETMRAMLSYIARKDAALRREKARRVQVSHEQLEADYQAWLDAGNRPQQIPFGVSAEQERYQINKRNCRPRRVK